MQSRKKKIILVSLVSIFGIWCLSCGVLSVASAQTTGIQITPLRIEELVDPGEVLHKGIKLTNLSDSTTTFYIYLMDFSAKGEGGQALLLPPGTSRGQSLASWIDINAQGIEFGPREKKKIDFVIKVPEDVSPGGRYGTIVLGTIPQPITEEGVVVSVGQQGGVLLLLRVSGNVIEDARIREFSVAQQFYTTPFKVNFVARIENLGNTHLKPHGIIEITNILGRKTTTLRINDAGANVLPDSIRRFDTGWEGGFAFGKYTASLALSFGTFAYEGGQGRQTVYAKLTFWILPLNIIIPVFLGIIFISALFALFLRLYKNKTIEKTLREAGLRQVTYVKKYKGPSLFLHFGLILLIILALIFLVGGVIFFLFFV